MNSYIDIKELKNNPPMHKKLKFICNNYFKHKFDLLGSGPVIVDYYSQGNYYKRKGKHIINYQHPYWLLSYIKPIDFFKNIKYAKNISRTYKPIDWHIDYKSGFRFDARKYDSPKKCLDIIGKMVNVDIKVVWELGRFYHMPQMAIFALFEPKAKRKVLREYKNQVLDFVVTNPYEKTVQWSCAMDVGIRCVNLLVAYDILKQLDNDKKVFDDNFEIVFSDFMMKHGEFILRHLEYNGNKSSNHYLSNLVGLIYVSSYLPSSERTDSWLVFGVQELIEQVKEQFHVEGSNVEGSTSYHCLCSDFVIYATALVMGVIKTNRKKVFSNYSSDMMERLKNSRYQKFDLKSDLFFPEWYWMRIIGMRHFIQSISKHDGEIIQVGDNDSGRLIKFMPEGNIISYKEARIIYMNLPKLNEALWFDENDNLRIGTMYKIDSMVENNDQMLKADDKYPVERSVIQALCKNTVVNIEMPVKRYVEIIDDDIMGKIKDLHYHKNKTYEFNIMSQDINSNLHVENWDMFGICIFRSDRMFLEITVDTAKNAKLYGHTHNDRLSIELMVDGKNILLDPGTYVYTSSIQRRNDFRSVKQHNTINVNNKEQNKFINSFSLQRMAKANIINLDKNYISLYEEYQDVRHIRKILITANAIIIDDYCNQEFNVNFDLKEYSRGYGKLSRL